jgi:hypothetical protein
MFESILTTTASTTTLSISQVLISIFIAFTTGFIISKTYMYTQKDYSDNFALTVILLPAVISIIIMLIGSDIARAFSLAGAFSIIRFRSAPGDPKDIAYVLFSMAAGLATGAGALTYALFFTIILCLVMLVLDKMSFGGKKNTTNLLQITIPEDLEFEEYIDEIMKEYTSSYTLKQIKTTALGSLYVLQYEVVLLNPSNIKAFLDALRCINSNLTIKLSEKTLQYAS